MITKVHYFVGGNNKHINFAKNESPFYFTDTN